MHHECGKQDWYVSFKKVSPVPIPQLPIWGNESLNIPFNEQRFNGKILYMFDIYKDTGERLSHIEIENILGTENLLHRLPSYP